MSPSSRRRAGLLIPLFSCTSTRSWGIGDIADLDPVTAWLAGAGMRVLQLLPLNAVAPGEQSPYSALSAMAIDPIYVPLADVPEVQARGGESALSAHDRGELDRARRATLIDYATVRRLKEQVLADAFQMFETMEWHRETPRARALAAFAAAESWWLDDYALFRALAEREGTTAWTEWPGPLQRRDPEALDAARRELAPAIRLRQYTQWLAGTAWSEARATARSRGVALFGDLPFMVDRYSADVWAHQDQFRLDASIGVPPDAFSATGQDWGMPAYRWDVLARTGFGWLRDRARRSAALFDGYRIDHLVGFYRTYSRPRAGGDASFEPADEAAQLALGEQTMAVFREPGSEIIAEDLGVVPDFVRESLVRQALPGFRVFRWEREWHAEGQPFRDPAAYPAVSVATSGTHDTEPLAVWWAAAPADERAAICALPSVERLVRESLRKGISRDRDLAAQAFTPGVRDALIESLFASGSDLVLFPIQDVFGWSGRINEPATVTPENWAFRLPWPVDRLGDVAEARERQAQLRAWARAHGRL
jgi:4-alpha-glucanotransferase